MAKERDISGIESKPERGRLPFGKNYLFTIGIDEYEHCPALHNAAKDAADVTKVLFEKYNFDSAYHFKLENKEATKDNIIDTFRKIKKTLKPNDNLLIYYSGHGELDEDFDESYWVTVECRKGKTGDYLPLDSLVKFVKAIKTHHTLLIIDACFAGAALVTCRSGTSALEKDPSRYVIASGRKEFASDGEPGKNSPFAHALIEKLRKSEEALLATDLGQYVMKQTIKASNETQRPIHNPLQIPEDKGGQFVFHPKAASEDSVWSSTSQSKKITALQAYLQKYPQGKYLEEAYWQIAVLRNTEFAYDDYLEQFQNGKYADEAEQKMNELEEENIWKEAQKRDSLTAYRSYARRYRKGKYRQEALDRINTLKTTRAEENTEKEIQEATVKKAPLEKPKLILPAQHLSKVPNSFKDPRDGQVYKTVKLKDGKVWLAQNLSFDIGDSCWLYKNDANKEKKYGRLYTWEAAKKACPTGWHLPSDEEWRAMAKHYGGHRGDAEDGGKAAYKALIEGGDSGFSALLGGYRSSDGLFLNLGVYGYYWSSTEHVSDYAWYYYFFKPFSKLYRYYHSKTLGFSCRCIQD